MQHYHISSTNQPVHNARPESRTQIVVMGAPNVILYIAEADVYSQVWLKMNTRSLIVFGKNKDEGQLTVEFKTIERLFSIFVNFRAHNLDGATLLKTGGLYMCFFPYL